MKKIAITGGIASGKSTVCRLLGELGAYVVSADAIVHELLKTDTDLGQRIVQQFGPDILESGQIDRRAIADKAFKDSDRLKELEELLHPAVLRRIKELYAAACNEGSYSSFVVEIPLLFEIGAETFYDVVVAVFSEESLAKGRFERAGFQKTEYDLRMKRQLTPEQKAAKSQYVIINNGSLDALRDEVVKLDRILHKH
ncbi:MAG: dephospho-CoA kinase [Chlamydiales bacterium]